ncbi:MAG: hypothetical protein VX546_02935 [Myxococcota bacterium]|nr:hypothetical protein [Myxococcota bacterium]
MVDGEAIAWERDIRPEITAARDAVLERIAGPGSWWTGAERAALVSAGRAAWAQRATPPWLREAPSQASEALPGAALAVARTVAADAHRIDREWSAGQVAELGDAAYVEIVGLIACSVALDAFCGAVGATAPTLPAARGGDPDRVRPGGLADIGAFVPMTDPFPGPNVGRALSLAPGEQQAFFRLVGAMYAVADFQELVWERPLDRPQVELVAARVSALNECFY